MPLAHHAAALTPQCGEHDLRAKTVSSPKQYGEAATETYYRRQVPESPSALQEARQLLIATVEPQNMRTRTMRQARLSAMRTNRFD